MEDKKLLKLGKLLEKLLTNYWKSCVAFLLAVYVLSGSFKGLYTLVFSILFYYMIHSAVHTEWLPYNLLQILHDFHHESDCLLSLYLEIVVVELGSMAWTMYLSDPEMIVLDPWILTLFALFYAMTHNINYSILRVNETHYMHHQNVQKNLGLDICDIVFGTKADDVENTDHYIPNILFLTFMLYFFQNNNNNNNRLIFFSFFYLSGISAFLAMAVYCLFFLNKVFFILENLFLNQTICF
jgi:hypothetical protein